MAKYQVSTFYKGQGSGFIINGDFNSVLDKMQKHFLKLNKKAQFKQINLNSWHILENGKTIGKLTIEPVKQTQDGVFLSFMDRVIKAFRDSEKKYYRVVLKMENRGFSDLINCVVFANNKVEAGQKALSYYKNKYKADMKKGNTDFILLKVAEHENQKIAKANL